MRLLNVDLFRVRTLLERDFYFRITTRRTGIYRRGYSVEMQPDKRPLLIAENNQRNFPARKILLVPDVLVGAEKHVVSSLLGLLNQFAVLHLVPANLSRICDFVAG